MSSAPSTAPGGAAGVWQPRCATPPGARSAPRLWDAGGLLLVTLLMVLYPFEYDTGRSNFSLGDGIVVLVALTQAFRALHRPIPLPRYTPFVVALVLVAIASATANVIRPSTFFTGARVSLVETSKLVMAMLWMCTVFWLLSRRFTRRFLQLAGTSVLFATAAAIGSILMTVTEATDARPTGPFENANLYAGYLSFNVFLALAAHGVLAGHRRPENRRAPLPLRLLDPLLLFGCVPLLALGIVSTGSRGALIGTTGGLALSGLLRPRLPSGRQLLAIATLLAVAAGALSWYVRQEPLVLRRLVDTAEGDPKGVGERLMLWEAARETFAARPVLGAGYGQFRYFALIATGENKIAHQTYLSIAAELGVAGLIVFGALLAAVLRDTLRPARRAYPVVTRAGRGYLLAVLVQGMFMNVQHSRAMWICFGVLAVQAASGVPGRTPARRGTGPGLRIWRET